MAGILETANALVARLGETPGIGERVYPDAAPDPPTFPLITYRLADTERVLTSRQNADPDATDWTVVVHAEGAKQRVEVAEVVVGLLAGWSASGVVQTAFVVGDSTGYNGTLKAFTYDISVRVWSA